MSKASEAIDEVDYEIVDPARRPRKWAPGVALRSLEEVDLAVSEERMLWLVDRPQHARFVANLNYSALRSHLRRGVLKSAVVTLEYVHWLERELRESTPLLPF